jgi:hypothetical protein
MAVLVPVTVGDLDVGVWRLRRRDIGGLGDEKVMSSRRP